MSPKGPPSPPPPLPAGATASCADLSGEWASSVFSSNYQPLRAGLIVKRVPPPPPGPSPPKSSVVGTISITSDAVAANGGAGNNLAGEATLHCLTDASSLPSGGFRSSAGGSFAGESPVALAPCAGGAGGQLWVREPSGRIVNRESGLCLDGAQAAKGQKPYYHNCVGGIGQTWTVPTEVNTTGEVVNSAAKTCLTATGGSSVTMEPCGGPSKQKQQWSFAGSRNQPAKVSLDYYNLTSTTETHWPAVPSSGWLLAVDRAAKTVRLTGSTGPGEGTLHPWLNPHANGQTLSPAADCTMLTGALKNGALMCKLPWCGESVRPVAAQMFNVLALGGEPVYYGERWQSTTSGLKSEDFSYMQVRKLDHTHQPTVALKSHDTTHRSLCISCGLLRHLTLREMRGPFSFSCLRHWCA